MTALQGIYTVSATQFCSDCRDCRFVELIVVSNVNRPAGRGKRPAGSGLTSPQLSPAKAIIGGGGRQQTRLSPPGEREREGGVIWIQTPARTGSWAM